MPFAETAKNHAFRDIGNCRNRDYEVTAVNVYNNTLVDRSLQSTEFPTIRAERVDETEKNPQTDACSDVANKRRHTNCLS